MTDTEQPIDAQGLADRLMDEVYNKLTSGAIDNADLDGMAFLVEQAADQLRTPPPTDTATGALAADVIRLVIAAREVAFGGYISSADEKVRKELDGASEAFAERVPWENER